MIYVPDQWAHMVVNIGDTVAIVSERGLKDYSGL
jgi:oxalate decarboxylase/phosphoglucose isomerase-like protein (cupin superfamily)